MVHGETSLAQARKATQIFFGGEIAGVSESELLEVFSDVPSVEAAKSQFGGDGITILDLLETATVTKSKGDSRRLIEGGGISLNNIPVNDAGMRVTIDHAIHGKFIVVRKGRKHYFLVKVT